MTRAAASRPATARRFIAALAALALAAGIEGCGEAVRNPFASFESRCAQLPSAMLDVVGDESGFAIDETQSLATLTPRSGTAHDAERTFGLTAANFGYSAELDLASIEDARGGRACGSPSVRVRLSVQPMVVYLAREIAGEACLRAATLRHEEEHVRVLRSTLGESVAELRDALRRRFGDTLRRAATQHALAAAFDNDVHEELAQFFAERQRLLSERQAAVDSPAAYAALGDTCGGAVRRTAAVR